VPTVRWSSSSSAPTLGFPAFSVARVRVMMVDATASLAVSLPTTRGRRPENMSSI
jgi:hypothetical protein